MRLKNAYQLVYGLQLKNAYQLVYGLQSQNWRLNSKVEVTSYWFPSRVGVLSIDKPMILKTEHCLFHYQK
jgi:hypothetical protein